MENGLTVIGTTVVEESMRLKVEETVADIMKAGRSK